MKSKSLSVLLGLIALGSCIPEPPSNNQGWGQQQQQQAPQQQSGWGQQQQQQAPQQQSGWGQQQQQQAPQQQSGWGQQQQQQPPQMLSGWGVPQPQQQQSGGWGQQETQTMGWGSDSGMSSKGQKGKGNVDLGFNFALGYQGEKGGQMKGSGGSGGWSSQPETNIKKPNFREILKSIIGIPREIKNLFKESGLWILFVPLIVIIPLLYVAYNAGRFTAGLHHGWGWDKRSSTDGVSSILGFGKEDWDSLVGFIQDPKVQQAAKGFMDEFVVKRVMKSVSIKEDKKETKKNDKKKSR